MGAANFAKAVIYDRKMFMKSAGFLPNYLDLSRT
jgi:hypothetical protein